MSDKIERLLVELLAIKLYEHDHKNWPVGHSTSAWNVLPASDKQIYRDMIKNYPWNPWE